MTCTRDAGDTFRATAEFLASVDRANRFIAERAIRDYQDEVLRGGSFSVRSPISGRVVQPSGCVVLPAGQIGYRVEDAEEPFWLLAGEPGIGYPLSAAWFPTRGALLGLLPSGERRQPPPPNARLALVRIKDVWAAAPDEQRSRERSPVLVIGHQNFAHHLWNELAGMERWLNRVPRAAADELTVLPLYEPLGPVEEILPAMSGATVARDRHAAGALVGASRSLATRIGSTLVTTNVRDAVTRFAREHTRREVLETFSVIEGAAPCFWVTVRLGSRTCDNQQDFLTELIRRIEAEFPDGVVLIDGFSFPADYDSGKYENLRFSFEQLAADVACFIDDLIQNLNQSNTNRLVNVSGLVLPEAITLAAMADYYVAHSGTIQHKIAWLHNTPGYIHSCQAAIRPGAQRWYAKQVEDGVPPSVAPRDIIEDTVLSEGRPPLKRNYNYVITDVPRLVTDVIDSARATLGLRSYVPRLVTGIIDYARAALGLRS